VSSFNNGMKTATTTKTAINEIGKHAGRHGPRLQHFAASRSSC
jgi:hypothetical protein